MQDLISIIVPVYNVQKYLKRCVNSILNQTYSNIQIILVDDGSKDNSGVICDEYGKKYNNIKVIHKENGGLGFSRNSGLERAEGKFVCFVDGDDYIMPNTIKAYYEAIKKTDADTCLGGFSRVCENSILKQPNPLAGKTLEGVDIIQEVLPRMAGAKTDGSDMMQMSVCMGLFTNEIIRKNNLRFCSEREVLSEDLVFDFDYYPLSKRVTILDSTGYCYCNNENSLTTRYMPDRFEKQIQLYQKEIELTKELGIYDLSIERITTTLISISRYVIKLEHKFAKQNGIKEAKKNIKKVCQNPTLHLAWRHYENSKAPLKSRPINFFIKKSNVQVLWIIMKLKNQLGI